MVFKPFFPLSFLHIEATASYKVCFLYLTNISNLIMSKTLWLLNYNAATVSLRWSLFYEKLQLPSFQWIDKFDV